MGCVVRWGCSWSCSGRLGEGVGYVHWVSLTSRWCVGRPPSVSCSWIARPSAPGLSGCRSLSNSALQPFLKWSHWLYSRYRVFVSIRPCTQQSLTTPVISVSEWQSPMIYVIGMHMRLHLSHMQSHDRISIDVPYNRKISQTKIFANFTDRLPFVNFTDRLPFAKYSREHFALLYNPMLIYWGRSYTRNFSTKISIWSLMQKKISQEKIFYYTVCHQNSHETTPV